MLATLVIGLREGLEAALIVGIIAAFLRQSGRSLVPMWVGVGLAVALSLAVGIGLALVEGALPQQAQEGLETVIGAIAVFFVAGMVVWMSSHARGLKADLEHEAADALDHGGRYALAVMAFLAVLKEGFETSVFLLATFSAAQSTTLAAIGAIVGIAIAVGIGWGIYAGGVRINLARFFRVTGAFLILVAAGLVISTLRTAHEAGWLNAGQQRTVDLSWLVAPGSVQSALITGVLGIPSDPRLVEVVGWVAFVVAMGLFVYWPVSRRPHGIRAARLQLGIAAGLGVLAVLLAVLVPRPQAVAVTTVTLVSASDDTGASVGTAVLDPAPDGESGTVELALDGQAPVTLTLAAADAQAGDRNGFPTWSWTVVDDAPPATAPASLTLEELLALGGGRLPRGVNAQANPGPFDAQWSQQRTTDVTLAEGALLDVRSQATTVVVLTGGGLATPRTVTPDTAAADVTAAPDHARAVLSAISAADAARTEWLFWGVYVPIGLVLAAMVFVVLGWRTRLAARHEEYAVTAGAAAAVASSIAPEPRTAPTP